MGTRAEGERKMIRFNQSDNPPGIKAIPDNFLRRKSAATKALGVKDLVFFSLCAFRVKDLVFTQLVCVSCESLCERFGVS